MSQDQKSLDKMTVKELREVAKELPELTGVSSMKKDELLSKIKEAKGIKEEKTAPPKKIAKKAAKSLKTVKDVKNRIVELRELKINATSNNDKQTASILRRKINILKKKTRKLSKAS